MWYYNPLLLIVLFNVKSLLANLCFLWVPSRILLLFGRQALFAAQICIPHLVIINVLRGKGGGKRTLFQSMFLPNSFWLNLQTKAGLCRSTSFLSHLSCSPSPHPHYRAEILSSNNAALGRLASNFSAHSYPNFV